MLFVGVKYHGSEMTSSRQRDSCSCCFCFVVPGSLVTRVGCGVGREAPLAVLAVTSHVAFRRPESELEETAVARSVPPRLAVEGPGRLGTSSPASGCSEVPVPLLQIMGNTSEFQKAVRLVIDTVSFDKDSTVQVFEATIR